LFDFCARVDNRAVNKKAIEALIKCGAFGSTGASRKGMLAVLEQAQGAGQKAQQDAAIGQVSMFDFGGGADADAESTGPAFQAPSHAPIPSEEFDRSELLAAEKESIGLFISEHPLKQIGAALRERTDCPLAELSGRRDGDWVTVGGMITEAKRLRTKKGDPMMFATLSDLDSSVELVVFGKALTGNEQVLVTDSIVLIRGRVDHKDRERTCLIAQEITPFQPTEEEVSAARERAAKPVAPPGALRLALDAAALPATVLGDLKELFAGFPGDSDVVIELRTSIGQKRLKLGREYRVARCAGLSAELVSLLGSALVHSAEPVADAGAAVEAVTAVGGPV
jgi:DNA polymerase-3 subunit alpha